MSKRESKQEREREREQGRSSYANVDFHFHRVYPSTVKKGPNFDDDGSDDNGNVDNNDNGSDVDDDINDSKVDNNDICDSRCTLNFEMHVCFNLMS